MNPIIRLALENVLSKFKVHEDMKGAVKEIRDVLLIPEDVPLYRYEIWVTTNEYESLLNFVHTRRFSAEEIHKMISEADGKKRPSKVLLEHGFMMAYEPVDGECDIDGCKVNMRVNQEGGF
jgi:hypothetical protein